MNPPLTTTSWRCCLRLVLAIFSLSTLGLGPNRSSCVLAAESERTAADIVFIVPDRSTAYPNGLHNGILASSYGLADQNLTVEVREYGNYVQEKSFALLNAAIETSTEQQPQVYCIWPMDVESKRLVAKLVEKTGAPVIQINQLPGPDTQWEWDHLLGYAGPSDATRASNAGIMMAEALRDRAVKEPRVVALGYPASYGGYGLSIDAFRQSILNDTNSSSSTGEAGNKISIVKEIPLARPDLRQSAYLTMVKLMDDPSLVFHGVYAMDDDILIGAYEALNDRGRLDPARGDESVTLVGTVCNGARELLETGKQYGTTIQAPYLEAALAMDQAVEYIQTGTLKDKIRFTPNPIATATTWEQMVVPFLGNVYAADALCTWNQYHERTNGLKAVSDAQDVCDYVSCLYIPKGLFAAGYAMVSINYALAFVCAVLLYVHRKKKIVQLAQPLFLALILFGTVVDTTSIIFMSRDNRTSSKEQLDASCFAWPWLLTLGQMLTTATLVAKIYRVKAVMGSTKYTTKSGRSNMIRKTKVTTKDVSGFIVGGLVVDVIVLAVWYGTDPFRWTFAVTSRDFQDLVLQARGECSSAGPNAWVYPFVILIFHLALLIYGNVLAFQTRHVHRISDSKLVAISLFNSIQLLILATVIIVLSGDNVSISYLIRASYAFLNNFGVIALVVVPKLYPCLIGKGNKTVINTRVSEISGLNAPSLSLQSVHMNRQSTAQSGNGEDNTGRRGSLLSVLTDPENDDTGTVTKKKSITFEDDSHT